MKSVLAAIVLTAAVPAAAAAPAPQSMTAGEFLRRAEPLMKKNKAALIFSSEARLLVRVLGQAAERNRARLDAQRAAGRPSACPPPKGKAAVTSTEILNYLRSLPPAQRQQSMDQAFAGLIARKYPCRG